MAEAPGWRSSPWLLLPFVLLSSLAGLLRAMVDDDLGVPQGFHLFADVWQSNLWADLAFVAGMALVAVAAVALMRRMGTPTTSRWLVAGVVAVVAVLLAWAVYAVSWSMALEGYVGQLDDGDDAHPSFADMSWTMRYDDDLLGHDNAWTFTWAWGWPGLLLSGALVPLWTVLSARRSGPAGVAAAGGATPSPPVGLK